MGHPSNSIPKQFVYATTTASHTPPGTNDYFYCITNAGTGAATLTLFGGGVFDVSHVDQAAAAAGKAVTIAAGITIYGRFTSVTTGGNYSVLLYF